MPIRPVAVLTCLQPDRAELDHDDRHALNPHLAPRSGDLADLFDRGAFEHVQEISLDLASHPCTETLRVALERLRRPTGGARRLVVDLITGQVFADHYLMGGRFQLVQVQSLDASYRDSPEPLMPGASLRLYCLSSRAPELLRTGVAEALGVAPDAARRYLESRDGLAVTLTDISRIVIRAAAACGTERLVSGARYRVGEILGTLHVADARASA